MRISHITAGLLSMALTFMIALSVSAYGQGASSPSQPSATAAPGTASPGTASPASPSTVSPQTSTTPGTTPGTGAQSQTQSGASAQPQGQSADENPLNLTEDQKAKLRPILMDERQQMEAVQNDASMSTDQKIAKAQQIRATATPKIKAILTPEQLQKLSDMQKAQQGQTAPATGAPPKH